MFNLQTEIVDDQRRATRPLIALLQRVTSPTATGMDGRITALETTVAGFAGDITALQAADVAQGGTIAANSAAITALQARMSDAEIRSLWVRPWP